MKKRYISIFLIFLFLIGCVSSGKFPQTTKTTVDLSRKNYRIVKANAVGTSYGFHLLGFIPIKPPTYTAAVEDLYSKAGMKEGQALAFVNVIQENSTLCLILFSLPRITVSGDIIEFTGEGETK